VPATDSEIRYTVVTSGMGAVLVGATGQGVCAALFGDAKGLPAELAAQFPAAALVRDDAGLREWADAIVESVEGRVPAASVPLDLRGTAFQRRVWDELRRIPPGKTASYAEIAQRVGRPSAARAVAGACAANRVAVVVPCHRVVRADGGLGGYRWGVDRKRALLDGETGAQR
jgi:AraC family transcriptional regulator, regulatory protein of adaptative response / methylated-DNA-[protein]-cysteine methyltransferase